MNSYFIGKWVGHIVEILAFRISKLQNRTICLVIVFQKYLANFTQNSSNGFFKTNQHKSKNRR